MIQIGATSATLDAPVEHLMACHRRIEQRLDTLVEAAGHLQNDRQRALEAIAKSLQFLDSNGAMHTADEEASLFPRLRPKLSAGEAAYLESLERQHGQADEIYGELKQLAARITGPWSPELAQQYRVCAARLQAFYRAHIQSEDEILLSLARRSLVDSELAAISAEMRQRRAL